MSECNKLEVFIKSITFNDGKTFNFDESDIVIFTGANNVGKSQVLRDIEQHIQSGNDKTTPIITNVDSDFKGDIDFFLGNTKQNKDGLYWTGTSFQYAVNIRTWWNEKRLQLGLSKSFVKFLNTEKRLDSSNPSIQFNRRTEEPSNPIQMMYSNDEKESEISEYFHKAFGKDLIVDRCGGREIPLLVGEKPIIDKAKNEDRFSKSYLDKLDKLPLLQKQGDGMRSFAGIILDTFTSDYTITLIDEPEAFTSTAGALAGKNVSQK